MERALPFSIWELLVVLLLSINVAHGDGDGTIGKRPTTDSMMIFDDVQFRDGLVKQLYQCRNPNSHYINGYAIGTLLPMVDDSHSVHCFHVWTMVPIRTSWPLLSPSNHW